MSAMENLPPLPDWSFELAKCPAPDAELTKGLNCPESVLKASMVAAAAAAEFLSAGGGGGCCFFEFSV